MMDTDPRQREAATHRAEAAPENAAVPSSEERDAPSLTSGKAAEAIERATAPLGSDEDGEA